MVDVRSISDQQVKLGPKYDRLKVTVYHEKSTTDTNEGFGIRIVD
jgi:hypothetical protein